MKKLKGSSDAVKMKYLLFVFAASIILALPIRIYQLLAIVDTTTGFFTEKDITVYVLFAVVVLFIALFMILSYMSKEVPSPKLPTGKNGLLGVTAAIMAVALFWDMIAIIRAIIPSSQISVSAFITVLRSQVSASGGFLVLIQLLFAFLAAIYFIVFATSNLNGKGSYKEYKFLAITPLCWAIVRIIIRLMHAISYLRVSELLIEIFMLVFLMLFFMTFARIASGVFTEDSMWGIYGYGFSAALLLALASIPRLVMILVGKEAVTGNEFNPADLACLIFVVSFIFASLGIGFKDGVKNRKTVTEVDLPDDIDVVIKHKDDEQSPKAFSEDIHFSVNDNAQYVEKVAEPKTVEAEPEAVEAEPETVEAEPETVEAEPETVEAEPEAVEVEPEAVEAEPETVEAEPETDAVKAAIADIAQNEERSVWEEGSEDVSADEGKLSRRDKKLLKKEGKAKKKYSSDEDDSLVKMEVVSLKDLMNEKNEE